MEPVRICLSSDAIRATFLTPLLDGRRNSEIPWTRGIWEWAVLALYLVFVVVVTGMLLLVVRSKAPKGRWRWGRKPGDDPSEDL